MKQQQFLGQLRAVLTALGTMLATWGITDGNQWAPIVGILLAAVSLTWGILHHKDPATPGKMSWSLFRKFCNVLGSALITYGFLNPDRLGAIAAFLAALGPLLASRFSWIDNSEPTDPRDDESPTNGLYSLLILAAAVCLLPSCGHGANGWKPPTFSIATPWGIGSKDAAGNLTLDTPYASGSKDALGNVTINPKAPIVWGTN